MDRFTEVTLQKLNMAVKRMRLIKTVSTEDLDQLDDYLGRLERHLKHEGK